MAVEYEDRSVRDGVVADDLKTYECLIRPIRIYSGRVTESWSRVEVDDGS